MDLLTEVYERIWRGSARRYAEHEAQRLEREKNMQPGGDWHKVEEPARVQTRLRRKGYSRAMTDKLVDDSFADATAGIAVLERIIEDSELQDVRFLFGGARAARSVGRIVIRSSSGRVLAHGTGFMVSPRLMLTNNHVFGSSSTAANSTVQFDYFDSRDGSPIKAVEFTFEPDTFFVTDGGLDFTLVAVANRGRGGETLTERGWNPLIRESGKVLIGEPVNIIQHPRGEPMQIAIRKNPVVDRLDDFLHYRADTEPGSSGSPVCNDAWEIAALHHSSVPRMDGQGRILMRNGQPWDRRRSTINQIDWIANEGVRVSRIVAHIDALSLDASRQALFDAGFVAPPVAETAASGSAVPTGPAGGGEPAVRTEADGSVSWYFRVNFGQVGSVPAAVAPAPGRRLAGPREEVPGAAAEEQPFAGLAQALINRERREEPYYDVEADAAARKAYYSGTPGIDDGKASPRAQFEALHALLERTHTEEISYRRARWQYLYPWVDRRESGELRNIYSGTHLDPAEVLRQELERVEIFRPGSLAVWQERGLESLLVEDDALEIELEEAAGRPLFNCEHVVPQSWFEKRQPMRADLHHLFTCEPDCNSFRSNIPYFDFDPAFEAEMSDCGRREGDKFEPEMNHGVVARSTLYFLLRYPNEIGEEPRELQRDRLKVLKHWHRAHKVTRYELHRNAVIAKAQGNRNPLIDFPDLIDRIDFAKGFG